MTDMHRENVEHLVNIIMDSLGPSRCQKQALLQAYLKIDLPGYPTLLSANLKNEAGQFVIAGERIKVMQRQAVQYAQKTLSKMQIWESKGEDSSTARKFDVSTSTIDPYRRFLQALSADSGTYLDDVDS